MADNIERIDAKEARERVQAGKAGLVCAYDDAEKCRINLLEGAMTLAEFRAHEASMPREQEIIFYCA